MHPQLSRPQLSDTSIIELPYPYIYSLSIKEVDKVDVDRRVLRDWEKTVHECIGSDPRSRGTSTKGKSMFLKLKYTDDLHENFVLVPADKAASNVIVVCKTYYLDMVIRELSYTSTYKEVHSGCMEVISRNVGYMMRNGIDVHMQQEQLPSFYWLPKLHKTPYSSRFIRSCFK